MPGTATTRRPAWCLTAPALASAVALRWFRVTDSVDRNVATFAQSKFDTVYGEVVLNV